ncbi:UNKNOWN [Stylonychia lemnae]|uniref:Uncharacterized protein n=1 Tax=Stylonychia lemnae TaxID=5949 RepID=A0A078ABW2_STYLE|nr:UNKNOWN [Stylonychia lemnae]|eukprot:CDW79689.1 UNKNOWN [Stylonychia lemnae]
MSSPERIGFTIYNLAASSLNYLITTSYNQPSTQQASLNQTITKSGLMEMKGLLDHQDQIYNHKIVKASYYETLVTLYYIFMITFVRTDIGLGYFGMITSIIKAYFYLVDPANYDPIDQFDSFMPKLIQGFQYYTLGNMIVMSICYVGASTVSLLLKSTELFIYLGYTLLPKILNHVLYSYLTNYFAHQYMDKIV